MVSMKKRLCRSSSNDYYTIQPNSHDSQKWRQNEEWAHWATQKGNKKSLGRQASTLGGGGMYICVALLTSWYQMNKVLSCCPLVIISTVALAIQYWGLKEDPTLTQQILRSTLLGSGLALRETQGTSMQSESTRLEEPMMPMRLKEFFRLPQMQDVLPMHVWNSLRPSFNWITDQSDSSVRVILHQPVGFLQDRLMGLLALKQLVVVPEGLLFSNCRGLPILQPILDTLAKLPSELRQVYSYLTIMYEPLATLARSPMTTQDKSCRTWLVSGWMNSLRNRTTLEQLGREQEVLMLVSMVGLMVVLYFMLYTRMEGKLVLIVAIDSTELLFTLAESRSARHSRMPPVPILEGIVPVTTHTPASDPQNSPLTGAVGRELMLADWRVEASMMLLEAVMALVMTASVDDLLQKVVESMMLVLCTQNSLFMTVQMVLSPEYRSSTCRSVLLMLLQRGIPNPSSPHRSYRNSCP